MPVVTPARLQFRLTTAGAVPELDERLAPGMPEIERSKANEPLVALTAAACKEDTFEEAGEKVDEGVEEVADEVDDATDG